MDIIRDSVNQLETMIAHSGCEESGILLEVNPDIVNCQYERGACMIASFGGRSAEYVTQDPIRAQTRISFMFGAPLDTPGTRGAACAIINVVTGFFCLSRVLHACPRSSHKSCRDQLVQEITGKRLYCIGDIPESAITTENFIVSTPEEADIILINGAGIIGMDTGDLFSAYKETKRIICIGPSTAGVARLQNLEHWCPFGTPTV
jgi:hypothetical protein